MRDAFIERASPSDHPRAMPPFASNPLKSNPIHRTLHKHPSLFGIPFLVIIVGASFALQSFTQTRYDLHDQKVTQVNKEQELGLAKNRKKFDIREEYFKLSAAPDEDWEPKRIERPKGLPEWGVAPPEPPARSAKP
ncbi:uncharacterized protein FIBRA_00768 [Fibroporia radiculosa]|uniref:Cytochrome c oxidase assembly protein COX16, mitochondrial n=1 Tax=Fibroporia radiculosa TaxID=599839 RepID=J4G0L3_9APHY|nr:uncharacterized protein FIBRA_00768 [Fibroporia radiculosa]CCL98763.1 predicted protein [Fibroporia radiculosa]